MSWGSLAALFGFALCVRLPHLIRVWVDPQYTFDPDSPLYHALAMKLLETGDFPSAFRTPLYPGFLGLCYLLGGVNVAVPVTLQLVLDAGTAVLVGILAFRIGGSKRIAVIASALYALNPVVLVYSSRLLAESLFTFLLVWAVLEFHRPVGEGRLRPLILPAVLFAAVSYCKPVGMVVPFLLSGIALLLAGRPRRRAALKLGVMLSLFTLLVLPWYARNHARFGVWAFSSALPVNLMGMSVPITMTLKEKPWDPSYFVKGVDREANYAKVWSDLKAKYGWEGERMVAVIPHPERNRILMLEFYSFFRKEWPLFFYGLLFGYSSFFHPATIGFLPPGLAPPHTGIGLINVLLGVAVDFGPILLLPFAAWRLASRRNLPGQALSIGCLALVLYGMAVHLHSGHPRFRTHVQPFLVALVAVSTTGRRTPAA